MDAGDIELVIDLKEAQAEIERLRAELASLRHDPRCAKCGHPKSNHPYRHPFVGIAQKEQG